MSIARPTARSRSRTSSFTLEYRGNWKLHLENAADIFHPSFVHSSSVAPARRAPANASILDQDQTREMLLANGFGSKEWEGIQLNGFAGGHAYMTNIYNQGVLVSQKTDPVADALQGRARPNGSARSAPRSVLGMNRFNNIIYPNLIINAQYQQMRVTIPVSVDRTIVRIHCFRLKGAPDEMFHRAVRFLTHARLAGLDDLFRRRRDAGALPAGPRAATSGPGSTSRAASAAIAATTTAACRARRAKCRCACSSRPGSTT